MSYDYHGTWEGRTGHVSPLYASPVDADKGLNVVRPFCSLILENLQRFLIAAIDRELLGAARRRPQQTGAGRAHVRPLLPAVAAWQQQPRRCCFGCWNCRSVLAGSRNHHVQRGKRRNNSFCLVSWKYVFLVTDLQAAAHPSGLDGAMDQRAASAVHLQW
jgi:hypothetical protein